MWVCPISSVHVQCMLVGTTMPHVGATMPHVGATMPHVGATMYIIQL